MRMPGRRAREMPGQQSLDEYRLDQVDVRLVLKETSTLYSTQALQGPEQAAQIMSEALRDLDREMVCVVNMDNKLRPINYNVVSIGSLSASLVPVQNVFKSSILSNAGSIMLLHNHPSGDVTPSREDLEITKRLVEAGKLMDIPVVDHVIIGAGSGIRYSFREDQPDLFYGSPDLHFISRMTAERKGVSDMANAYTSKMSFEEFTSMIQEEIRDLLPKKYQDAGLRTERINKLGEPYQGLVVRTPDQTVTPTINLDQFYEQYLHGMSADDVMQKMSEMISAQEPDISVDFLHDYSQVKENLFIRLSNAEKNAETLGGVPHRQEADLAMTYHIRIDLPGDGVGSTMVTNDMLKNFGVSEFQLHEDAMKNCQEMLPARFAPVATILFGVPEEEAMMDGQMPMMVLTNTEKVYGASALFYPDQLGEMTDKLGGNFFILPSSVHEIIAIPDDGSMEVKDLEQMVTEINASQVEPKDQLSDHVYHFDAWERKFELATDYEARMKQKEQAKGKGSILRKLDEKKHEAGRNATTKHHQKARTADVAL